jgi:hypothetical protein
VRVASRSASARSARMRRASRVSSRAAIRALVAVVSWSSACWWSARMRAVSSNAEAWACWHCCVSCRSVHLLGATDPAVSCAR